MQKQKVGVVFHGLQVMSSDWRGGLGVILDVTAWFFGVLYLSDP